MQPEVDVPFMNKYALFDRTLHKSINIAMCFFHLICVACFAELPHIPCIVWPVISA